MKDDDKLYEAPFLTLDEITRRWPKGELKNDMIRDARIEIIGHFGELVGIELFLEDKLNPLCAGYASTANVGFIIRRVSQLLALFDDDPRDFMTEIQNAPVRIYDWGRGGDSVMEKCCIGHFMKDRFIYGADLMKTGLPIAETKENK